MSCHKRSRSCPSVGKVPTEEIHGSEEIKLKREKRNPVQWDLSLAEKIPKDQRC